MKIFPLVLVLGLLSACVEPTPPEPVTTLNGKSVYRIFTSLQATREPTPEDMATAREMLRGPGRGNLADRAQAQCPGGYDIVNQTAPEAKYSMMLADGTSVYRIRQEFDITCR